MKFHFFFFASFIAQQTCHSLYVRFHTVACQTAHSHCKTLSTFHCPDK